MKRAGVAEKGSLTISEPIAMLSSLRKRLLIEDEDAFVSQIWEKRPAVFRGKKGSFRDLFSLDRLDRLIATRQLAWNSVTVLGDRSARRRDLSTLADVPSLREQSIYVHLAERYWRPLAELCRDAEKSFARPSASFLFLTPPETTTRDLHWDLFDVFILQLSGRRSWRLCPPVVELPIIGQEYTRYSFGDGGQPLFETELNEGDVLYIPRGVLHEAYASSSHSLHWTLGLRSIPWYEVVAETWRRSLEPLRRHGVPSTPGRAATAKTLADLLAAAGKQDPRAVVEDVSFTPGPQTARALPTYQAGNLLAYREHSTKKRPTRLPLYAKTGVRHVLRRSRAGTTLVLSQYKVWVPRAYERELEYVTGRARFRLESLPSTVDARRLSQLVETLCSAGFLERTAIRTKAK